MSDRVFLTAAVRTPIARRGGALANAHAPTLLGTTIRSALDWAAVNGDAIDQVMVGCVTQVGDQAYNIGRVSWLTEGLPADVPATTLDAQCGSSHQAVSLGAALIRSGTANLVVSAGVELMTRHPLGSNVAGGDGEPMGDRYRSLYEMTTQGEAAERIADHWGIDRAECDAIGLRSQELARAAWDQGRFDAEVVAVEQAGVDGSTVALTRDTGLRDTTREGLADLKPAFRPDGRHHAGNSSQISDGASAAVLASERAVQEYELDVLGEVRATAFVAVDPVLKLTGPIPATKKLLSDTRLSVNDIDLFEVNEAFASVLAAWLRETGAPLDRVNVNGGAIALGHPVGASGARLHATAVHELRRRGGGRAVIAMCCGGGLGTATLVEVRE